ncbi:stage V sporulation protein D [Mechercharimyces sp. CAU 1602]|uniref:stage V sporulation protein D n=1 Tax=Mechercharimyces sp. CAU 1602 TaxID=2973933 RepID=UPI0021619F2A|nr:stage V sporulation protein D [Mechercharimyces sp. CAU 1602]MCS1350619.1 stage V sporulation protein D [Mechercharimyces sp. CAU 1602]
MHVSNRLVRRRLFAALLTILLVFTGLIGRLGFVQLIKGEELSEQAKDLWNRDIPFQGKRGKILDRNGDELAYNISTPSILAIPAQIDDPAGTAQTLAKILPTSQEEIYQTLTKRSLMVYVPGGKKVSEETAEKIQALRLQGIAVSDDNKRHYPFDQFAAHVLGFAGVDNQGLAGIELTYDEGLRGSRGYVSFGADASGKKLPGGEERYTPPRDGMDLMLTVDEYIQTVLEREMDQAMAQHNPDNVLAIAMRPKTGEILGMGMRPSFQPNNIANTDPDIYNHNYPIWRTYEPGSTFKIITLASALEENKINLKNSFYDPGHIEVSGARLRCWKKGGHGSQTYLEVVENSCNPGFVSMGQKLGEKTLFSYIRKFGFGAKTGIDLNGEATGILFSEERAGPVELATTSFGQGVSVTPIQQVTAVSAAINGGVLVRPHLAKAWLDPETGETIETFEPEERGRVISEETSQQVRSALESVVAKGTGRKAFIDGYRVGGKTGTAQKVGPDGRYLRNNHIVSFIGFAPADDPEIVVYVAVDNPKGIQFGGVVAAPIVQNILEDSLMYMGVERRKDQIPPEKVLTSPDIITVPDLIGEDMDRIRQSLHHYTLNTSGNGSRVVDQMPKPGERVKKGTPIHLYLGDKLDEGD